MTLAGRNHSEWQRRAARAEGLAAQHEFAAEILRFYAAIARFQEELHRDLGSISVSEGIASASFSSSSPPGISAHFPDFLALVARLGPAPLAQAAVELGHAGLDSNRQSLSTFWDATSTAPGPHDFFARAFLQPYAVSLRQTLSATTDGSTPYLCPHCHRKPVVGVLRPLREGSQRNLVCSFCLAEWEFRRILCPACGETDYAKLPVFSPDDFSHVRVEACDTCRSYIKTVDMTKQGRAEPIVDEIAAVPLDVWAQKQGYAKLQTNLMQM